MPPPIILNRALIARGNKYISRVRVLPSKSESRRVLCQVKFLALVKEPLPLALVPPSPRCGAAAAEVHPPDRSSRCSGSTAPETALRNKALRMEGEKGGGGWKGRREGDLERVCC